MMQTIVPIIVPQTHRHGHSDPQMTAALFISLYIVLHVALLAVWAWAKYRGKKDSELLFGVRLFVMFFDALAVFGLLLYGMACIVKHLIF